MTSTTATPPHDLVYDPYEYQIHEDPYPTYARLREEAPVYRNDERQFWALSRHTDVLDGFRNSEELSSAHGVTLDPSASGPHAHKSMSFLAMDPPRHGRMRALVSRGFTPRRVLDLEPRIRELTRQHLHRALDMGSFDFIGDIAGLLPMDVISELIGVPEVDRADLRRQADLLVHREEGVHDVPPEGVHAALSLAGYYADMIKQRRASRTNDLTSALIDAEIDGDHLTDDDIISFLFLMVVAGNETTTKLLGHAWYWGWKNPDQLAIPWNDPAEIPAWVEETLRYDTSTQMLARVATTDITRHGETIPAGDRVLLLLGSANRDASVFPEPDEFRLNRPEIGSTVSFGFGRHFCLGASLARLEARVALEELVAAIAKYDIDEDASSRVHSINVRGFDTLPTTVTAR